MLDSLPEQSERQQETVDAVLRRLRELHAQAGQDLCDADRISEGMSSQILGETTLRAQAALVEKETRCLEETAVREQWEEPSLQREIALTRQSIAAGIFKEHWYESTLSTPQYPIHAATYGTLMFLYDLRMLMAKDPAPERLQEFAWVAFDMDSLRSFKDCTSHPDTTRFLQGVARIFVDPRGRTNARLRACGVRAIPMATGGDEFELYLRANSPLSPAFVGGVIASFQDEISSNAMLCASLDFDSEEVRIKYGIPSRKERKAFAQLDPGARAQRLEAIKRTLPDAFTPSISGGKALLTDGILLAVEKDTHDLLGEAETFRTLREKIIQSTIDIARDAMDANKTDNWQALATSDPKRYAFRHRNAENRKLLEENRKLLDRNQELLQLEEELRRTRASAHALLSPAPSLTAAPPRSRS